MTSDADRTDPRGTAPLDPQSGADELFAHGLLEVLHEFGDERREGRVARVMQGIRPAPARAAPRRHRRRFSKLLGAGTLLTALAVAFVFLATPSTSRTYAAIEDSISVLRSPGDRRYEVRAEFGPLAALRSGDEGEKSLVPGPHAVVDTRAPGLMLLQLHALDGRIVTVGRDAQGEWAIRPDGRLDRRDPRRAWPGWAMQDGDSVFADSLDRWLEAFAQSYDLTRMEDGAAPGAAAGVCQHIVGIRRPAPPPLIQRLRSADRIEVWIDASTKAVERMEMTWRSPPLKAGAQGRLRPGPGPRPEQDPAGRSEPAEPPFPPPNPEGGPDDHPGPGDDGPPPDRPDSERPPPHRLEPGADGPRALGRGLLRRPPLRRLVIQRIETPVLDPNWFSPEFHAAAK